MTLTVDIDIKSSFKSLNPISKFNEISAYEALWDKEGSSYKSLAGVCK